MELSIKNIGKIANADIKLNGITVVAGENNTGKSTIGKVLYSYFSSCYNLDSQILKTKISGLTRSLDWNLIILHTYLIQTRLQENYFKQKKNLPAIILIY